MPFTHLVSNHKCSLPTTRDDNSALISGDRWQCDEPRATMSNGKLLEAPCNREYEWAHDQREGNYWKPINKC